MHYWSLKVLPILAYCDLWTCGSGKHLRSSSPVSTGVTSPFGSNFGYLLCIRSLKIISKCNIYLLTHSYTQAQIDKYHSIQGSLLYAMCETQHTHNIFLAWNISPNTVQLQVTLTTNPNHIPFLKFYTLVSLGCLRFSETHLQLLCLCPHQFLSLEARGSPSQLPKKYLIFHNCQMSHL